MFLNILLAAPLLVNYRLLNYWIYNLLLVN